jgi:hypothetical protein
MTDLKVCWVSAVSAVVLDARVLYSTSEIERAPANTKKMA